MVLLFVLLLCLLADSHAATNFKKTDSCPSSIIRWGNRESMFACPAETPYHCILMYNSSQLYEGCMASVTIEPEEEGCPWILIHKGITPIHGSIHSECPVSNPKCPPADHRGYLSNQLYQYPACFLPRSERNPAIPDSTTSRPITVKMQKTSSPPTENGVNAILISVLVIVAIVGVLAIVVLVVVLKRKKGGTSQSNPGTHQKMENELMKHIEEEVHTCEFTTENEKCESDNVDEVSPLLSSKECTNSNDPDEGLQLISTKDTQKESSSNEKDNTRGLEDTQRESSTSNQNDNIRGLKDTKKESSASVEKDNTRGLKVTGSNDSYDKSVKEKKQHQTSNNDDSFTWPDFEEETNVKDGSNEIDESDKENKQHHTPSVKDTQKESSTSNQKDNTRGLEDESLHRVATSMETGNSLPDSDVTLDKHTTTFQTDIVRDVIKTFLDAPNGVAEYQHVLMTLLNKGLQDGKLLETLLKENGHIFHLLEEEECICFVAPYLFDVQICNDYQKSSLLGKCVKGNCESFHICISFMKGLCTKSNCKYSHTYSDAHNSQIKQRLHLSSYSDSEINKLLGNKYPKICPVWRCLGDTTCPYLHVCQSFCMAYCKYEDKCKKGHSFETEHNKWILQAYNISTKSIWSGSDLAKRLVLAKT